MGGLGKVKSVEFHRPRGRMRGLPDRDRHPFSYIEGHTMNRSRREFLTDVGSGMFIASMGPALAAELGLSRALADAPDQGLTFGPLEPLVALMEETPPDKLLPIL